MIFVEDNVWVRTNPTFHGRVSIASGRLATAINSYTSMTIADDVLYSTKNGSDAIGLIAEKDILVAPYAPPSTGNFNFEIDAATLAQTGSVNLAAVLRWLQYLYPSAGPDLIKRLPTTAQSQPGWTGHGTTR